MANYYYLIGTTRPTGEIGLTYQADQKLVIGQLVEIKLRNRRLAGVILESVARPKFATKPIERSLQLEPLPEPLLNLGRWLAEYYVSDPASAWQTIMPSGLLKTRRQTTAKFISDKTAKAVILTPDQQAAVKAVESSDKVTSLIQGVTGSGKTEVYMSLAWHQLEQGKSSIILVPEIALTPQTEARFRASFGNRVLVTHSGLTEANRFAIWRQALASTEPRVVIGPRSALFLPVSKLGLIVIDECQETSYKQDQMPRFEAAVAAAQLARLSGAKLVLGSATPGLREAYLAQSGVINKITLQEQFNKIKPQPPIIVDLRNPREFADHRIFSRTLTKSLTETFEQGRQSLLFLNRRGSAASQLCTNCSYVSLCPRCHLPMTFHADKAKLICHSCNFGQTPPAICPSCGQATLRFLGIGTKRVESELEQLLPQARIARLDRDSLASGVEQLYSDLRDHKIDVLIGTQMVAKGLDFPAMETIGVILADSSLYLPDYTATERTYSLLTQVSGRAGRGLHPGRTIIQTYSAQHPAIEALAHGDYWQFAAAELAERRSLGYPPFNFLLKLTYAHRSDEAAAKAAGSLATEISQKSEVKVLGPAPAWRQFAGGTSHWQLIIKSPRRQFLQQIAASLPKGWSSDLDPVNVL